MTDCVKKHFTEERGQTTERCQTSSYSENQVKSRGDSPVDPPDTLGHEGRLCRVWARIARSGVHGSCCTSENGNNTVTLEDSKQAGCHRPVASPAEGLRQEGFKVEASLANLRRL